MYWLSASANILFSTFFYGTWFCRVVLCWSFKKAHLVPINSYTNFCIDIWIFWIWIVWRSHKRSNRPNKQVHREWQQTPSPSSSRIDKHRTHICYCVQTTRVYSDLGCFKWGECSILSGIIIWVRLVYFLIQSFIHTEIHAQGFWHIVREYDANFNSLGLNPE